MDAVSDIKAKLALEDVVADYLELKRSGSNLKALSPFSQEKTPSFMVSPAKQIWHDFSSNKGGDMFTFIQEVEGVEFKEALELLARKAGLNLDDYQTKRGPGREVKKQYERALNLSARFYQEQLIHNKAALDYVTKKRGFNKQSIIDFNIGYAPNKTDALSKYLLSKDIDTETIVKSGLAVERRGRLVDMFRGRVLVALADRSGSPIGFTGRQLIDGDGPKYINTAQTILYDKSRHVFGLHLAKDAIRKQDLSVLAEGNLDVVSAHQAGFKNVVATAGTALTIQQLKSLKHLSKNIALAFDGDEAGVRATIRAIPLAQGEGITLYVLNIPKGSDPDDIIQNNPADWEEIVTSKVYAPEWLRIYYLDQYDLKTAQGKKLYADAMMNLLLFLKDPVEQEHYLDVVAKDIKSSKAAVAERFSNFSRSPKKPKKPIKTSTVATPPRQGVVANDLLALSLRYPAARAVLQPLSEDVWQTEPQRAVFTVLQNSNKLADQLESELKEHDNFVKVLQLIAEQRYDDWRTADVIVEADQLSLSLNELKYKQNKTTITEQIRAAEERGDWDTAKELLEQWQDS
ncbi:TPA: DNA primase [Candidatus Saccharibacteria bacterium]|nr:DNA primase [Candidatus Saccharibacteria bacterium]HIO87758.1 DNA primase [Candidatus Saccharibacteria bacterium]